MKNQQGAPEAPKSTALDGKTELFHVLGHPLLVRAVDFNRLYAEKERLAALVDAQQPAPSAAAAAPAEQPDTAYAGMPAECDSPELCAVSRSCAGQFGTKRICASRGQAPAQPNTTYAGMPDERAAFEAWAIREGYAERAALGLWWRNGVSEMALWAAWQARAALASPTPQADSQPAAALEITAPNDSGSAQCIVRWQIETPKGWIGAWNREALDYLLGRAPADSVLEDAALLKEARDALWQPANVALCERIDAYLDAASKQGANHD